MNGQQAGIQQDTYYTSPDFSTCKFSNLGQEILLTEIMANSMANSMHGCKLELVENFLSMQCRKSANKLKSIEIHSNIYMFSQFFVVFFFLKSYGVSWQFHYFHCVSFWIWIWQHVLNQKILQSKVRYAREHVAWLTGVLASDCQDGNKL